ncbi:MAG: aspartyl protease family protein [Pseudomonadota bacterium]
MCVINNIFKRLGNWAALLALALAGALSAAAPVRAQTPIATVPYFIGDDGALTVEVMVNGRGPYNFIIDTGATLTLAFDNLAAIEKFSPTGAPKRRVLGISGSATLDTYQIGDIAVGEALMPDHIGVILPDWSAPRKTPHGILGIDFFRRYAVVFNVRDKTLELYPHGAIPKARINRWRTVNLKPESYAAATGSLYTAQGFINGSPATYIIDLGSVATLVNYEAAKSIFSGTISQGGASSVTSGSRLNDVFDDRTVTMTGRFKSIRVGSAIWRYVTVWLRDAPIFDELGVQTRPFGLLGADLLATQDFAIDFGENRLYISKINQKKR